MRRATFAAVIGLCAFTGQARADVTTQTVNRGVQNTGVATSSPGTPFSLDFRPINAAAPYHTLNIALIFDDQRVTFSQLNLQLDSSPTVFQFLPTPLNNYQVAYTIYDPTFYTPGNGYPTGPEPLLLPQAWRDELADGVLSGQMWISEPGGTPGAYLFSVGTTFAVPDPASCGIAVILLAPALLTRRRRAT